jgi:hypothetical protein
MNTRATMRRFGLFLLALMVGLSLTIRADGFRDGDDQDQACRDDGENHEHNKNTPLKLIGVIPVPGNPIISADIAWVDPGTEAYYLADRSNAGVDIIDVESNFYVGRVGHMVGVVGPADGTTANNGSGPNGVVVTPGRRLWAGDGNETLVVADVNPDSPTSSPSTSRSQTRPRRRSVTTARHTAIGAVAPTKSDTTRGIMSS